jgi:hypothetical protein
MTHFDAYSLTHSLTHSLTFSLCHRFFNITVSVTKIYSDGKTSTLGKRFAALCLTTSLLAVINGVCVANIFGALFTSHTVDDDDEEGAEVELKCPDGMGKVTVDSSGRLICLQDYQLESLNIPDR